MISETSTKRFRIAFSFAGEKRAFVKATAQILAERLGEDKILYDKFHEAEFAYANLAFDLPSLYKKETDLIVTVLCHDYKQKEWCGLEWRAIFSMIKSNQSKKVLLSRFDFVEDEDLNGLAGFIDLDEKTPELFVTRILQRLAINEGKPKDHYTKDCAETTQVGVIDVTQDSYESHKNLAFELLEKSEAYLTKLKALMKCADATEIINHFGQCKPRDVNALFIVSRKALNKVRFADLNESDKHDVFEAVTALYLLAALRLVDVASVQSGYVVLVPSNERILCAIIATALFGGSLKVLPDYDTQLPVPEYAFEINVPAAGDYVTESFERAMYVSIFKNNKKVDLSALDSQKLSQDEISDLNARLESLREIDEQNLCLVVTGNTISADNAVPVSNTYKVPTLFQSDDTANVLLGMSHQELTAKIKEFWQQLNELRSKHLSQSSITGVQ
jgi:TIR domain